MEEPHQQNAQEAITPTNKHRKSLCLEYKI